MHDKCLDIHWAIWGRGWITLIHVFLKPNQFNINPTTYILSNGECIYSAYSLINDLKLAPLTLYYKETPSSKSLSPLPWFIRSPWYAPRSSGGTRLPWVFGGIEYKLVSLHTGCRSLIHWAPGAFLSLRFLRVNTTNISVTRQRNVKEDPDNQYTVMHCHIYQPLNIFISMLWSYHASRNLNCLKISLVDK